MSTVKTKIPLAQAIEEAKRFRDLFEGCYERWEFAGSIRRQKAEVGDIDHVVIPRWVDVPSDLFGGRQSESAIAARARELDLERRLFIRSAGDRRISVEFEGQSHELYCCCEGNWGPILAIRTGSGDFSKGLVTRLRRHGHRQHHGRLCRVSRDVNDLELRPGAFQFEDDTIGIPVPCPTEKEYFAAAGLNIDDWPPERREAAPR